MIYGFGVDGLGFWDLLFRVLRTGFSDLSFGAAHYLEFPEPSALEPHFAARRHALVCLPCPDDAWYRDSSLGFVFKAH